MFDFHKDKETYFDYQYRTSAEYIIPFIEQHSKLDSSQKVLEIGCAEAGVLKAFTERGHQCVGIELSQSRVDLAEKFMKKEVNKGLIRFISKDIYDIDLGKDIGHRFDLIILKDVIEHIPEQDKLIRKLKDFLSPKGKIFFAFPPWQMPFGGHQQVCNHKLLSVTPYFHLLPRSIYKRILKIFGEQDLKIKGLLEIKSTGISIERFQRVVKEQGYRILKRRLFLTNPIYKYKFNLKTRTQFSLIAALPFLRNFVTTCAYYIIEKTSDMEPGENA